MTLPPRSHFPFNRIGRSIIMYTDDAMDHHSSSMQGTYTNLHLEKNCVVFAPINTH